MGPVLLGSANRGRGRNTGGGTMMYSSRRGEELRKTLAIGNFNLEQVDLFSKGLQDGCDRYLINQRFRTIPLSKEFAEILRGLSARVSWMAKKLDDDPLLSAVLKEYGIDTETTKELLRQLERAASDQRSRLMGIGIKPEEAASDARSLMMGGWIETIEQKNGVTEITSRFDRVNSLIVYAKSMAARRGNVEKPETTLFRDLRQLFIRLGGTKVIGRGGLRSSPLYRFAMACAKLIDRDFPFPNEKTFLAVLRKAPKA
jgi:hypothetical protein